VPNAVVEVLHQFNDVPVTLYSSAARTPAATPYKTDEDGNFAGYYAEPGTYRVRCGDHPEITTSAVVGPEEVEFIVRAPGPAGPVGAQGAPGSPGARGPYRWKGHGPPGTIIGSQVGDEYVDLNTGDLYVMNP
jgi:hypothetical protein